MRKTPYLLAGMAMIAAIMACNLPASAVNPQQDPGAVGTAAALTVQAQLSQPNPATANPVGPTATFTPIPLPTLPLPTIPAPVSATPTSNCDSGHFLTDVTYPDGTVVPAGTSFTKTWRIQNTGTCSWTPSYALVFISGDLMSGPTVQALSGNVNPGQSQDVSVALIAPSSNGTYTGNWGIRNSSGVIFTHFYVQIKVGSGSSGGSSGGSGSFQVNHVNFTVSGSCPNFNISIAITTTAAGTVTYNYVSSDGGSYPVNTLIFSSAGTQTITSSRYFGVAHSSMWVDIYVDSPNHQQFGRATLTCP